MRRTLDAGWVTVAAVAIWALGSGCARSSQLHWRGGDAFSALAPERRPPSRHACPGTMEERFACFAAKARERLAGTSSTLTVVTDEGALLASATTEAGQAAPTTSETVFPLLSVTKMFTAATAVLLARAGILDLHRPIAAQLPELADAELGRVTLHQLLTHTAGLVDVQRPQCERGEDLSDVIERAHVGAPPGVVHLYSNVGYALAGLVIERATSRPFEDVVRDRVLAPMGMSTATFDFARVPVRGHPEGAGDRNRCRLMHPAGGLNASTRDLALWSRAMSEPGTHPLGRELVAALTTPYEELGAPGTAYGYGVFVRTHGDTEVHFHSGGLEDFSAMVAWVPSRRLGVAAALNTPSAAGATPAVIVLRLLSVLLDLPDDWQAVPGSPRPASAYVGTYVDRRSRLGRVRVRLEDDHLVVDYLDGQPAPFPATFVFRLVAGEERARYIVTYAGVGERVADE